MRGVYRFTTADCCMQRSSVCYPELIDKFTHTISRVKEPLLFQKCRQCSQLLHVHLNVYIYR